MPSAGPLYLEDIPALQPQPVPVTGAKRRRSFGGETLENDLVVALDVIAAEANIPPVTRRLPRPKKLSRRPAKRLC